MTFDIVDQTQNKSELGDGKSECSTVPVQAWLDSIAPQYDPSSMRSLNRTRTNSAHSLKVISDPQSQPSDSLVCFRRSDTWARQVSPDTKPTLKHGSSGLLVAVGRAGRRKCCHSSRVHPIFWACSCTLSLALIRTLMPSPVGLINDSTVDDCESKSFCFCPRETICVKKFWSAILLLVARCSAYFDYPMYMVLFLTKARNLIEFLQGSYLSVLIPLDNLHGLHELAGKVVAFEVFLHTGAHLLRWWLDGTQAFLWTTQTGITGLVAIACVPFIAWVAILSALKRRASFELRKALHYLSIIWGVAICFHAPQTHIFFVIGIPFLVYLLDLAYGFFKVTHLIPTLHMKRVGRSTVEIRFENPHNFDFDRPSFIYLCLPWVSKLQWHAFSIYSPKKGISAVCISAVGDWTKDLHAQLARPSVRPGFLCGPFACPAANAMKFDNILCIVSGIGITAALAVLEDYKESRRISVIWVCRERALIELFLDSRILDTRAGMLLYYTGDVPLRLDAALLKRHPRLLLFEGRPDLERTVIQVIQCLEKNQTLPSRMLARSQRYFQKVTTGEGEAELCDKLCSQLESYSVEELFDMAVHFCRDGGFSATGNDLSRDDFTCFVCALLSINEPEKEVQGYIGNLFDKFDENGDGGISFDEFLTFFKGGENASGSSSTCNVVVEDNGQAISPRRSVSSVTSSESLEAEFVCEGTAWNETWELMYCGSSQSMMKQVQKVSKMYSMSFSTENFAW